MTLNMALTSGRLSPSPTLKVTSLLQSHASAGRLLAQQCLPDQPWTAREGKLTVLSPVAAAAGAAVASARGCGFAPAAGSLRTTLKLCQLHKPAEQGVLLSLPWHAQHGPERRALQALGPPKRLRPQRQGPALTRILLHTTGPCATSATSAAANSSSTPVVAQGPAAVHARPCGGPSMQLQGPTRRSPSSQLSLQMRLLRESLLKLPHCQVRSPASLRLTAAVQRALPASPYAPSCATVILHCGYIVALLGRPSEVACAAKLAHLHTSCSAAQANDRLCGRRAAAARPDHTASHALCAPHSHAAAQ